METGKQIEGSDQAFQFPFNSNSILKSLSIQLELNLNEMGLKIVDELTQYHGYLDTRYDFSPPQGNL